MQEGFQKSDVIFDIGGKIKEEERMPFFFSGSIFPIKTSNILYNCLYNKIFIQDAYTIIQAFNIAGFAGVRSSK